MIGALQRSLVALVLAAAAFLPVHSQSVEIIVHPDTKVTSIRKAELSKIFLKRLRTWEDGSVARPVDQVPGNPVREDFSRLVHGRSVVNVEVYWKRRIFSGGAVPPTEVADDEAVIEFVRTTPGAVGYVRKSLRIEGVRRLVVED